MPRSAGAGVRRTTAGVLVALAALAGPFAGAASAGDVVVPGGASIGLVEPGPDGLRILVSVPVGTEVDLDDVAVTVAGVPTTATAEPAGDAPADAVLRTTVLAIDTSDSMAGERFDAARTAALTFLDEVPDDVRVGVVTFAGEVVEALAPSTDRDAAAAVVEDLELSRGTRLYDGVLAALELVGEEGQRNVLVLSDGADTSRTPLEDVTDAVTDAGAVVDVVALEQDADATGPLEELAGAGAGRVVGSDAAALRAAFSAQADALARQVLVTAPLPAGVDDAEATVQVVLGSATGDVVAEAFAEVQGAAVALPTVPRSSSDGPTVAEPVMYVGVAALGAALLVVAYLLVPRPAPAAAEDRVSAYTRATGAGSGAAAGAGGASFDKDAAIAQATGAAASLLDRNRSLEARIAKRLEGAGSRLKPAEWLLMEVGIVVAAALVGLLLGGGNVVVALLLGLVGAAVPWVLLGVQRGRRLKAFNAALPDTLSLMSGSLAAGLSLAQSVDTIVREGQEPIASEFKRVLVETRLGVSLEDALEGITDRFDSKDFAWVVMAIRIQRQVGGNLGELLNTVAATMREREYLRRQVATLSAEGRLSAYVLGGLPPFFLLYLVLTQRDYVMPLFTEPLGWVMLAGAGVLLGTGILWMSRIVKVEV